MASFDDMTVVFRGVNSYIPVTVILKIFLGGACPRTIKMDLSSPISFTACFVRGP